VVLAVNLVTLVSIVAVFSLGLADYLGPLFPGLSPVKLGLVNVVITTLLAFLNIRTNSILTGVFLSVELLLLLVLSYFGFAHPHQPLADILFHPVHANGAGVLEPVALAIVGLAMTVAIFACNGYGQAVYLGEETHDAATNVARVILAALAVTIIAEAVPVTAVLLGSRDLKAALNSKALLMDFVGEHGGERLKTLMSLGIALAIVNASIAAIVLTARQFFSTGRDQVWPGAFNRSLTRIHGRFHSPWMATLVVGFLAGAACLVRLDFLLVLTGTSLVAVYAALCLAALVGRRQGTTSHGRYRMPWFPIPALAGLASLGYAGYASYLDEAVGRPSLVVTGAMILVSAGYYIFVVRRRGAWVLRGPGES
jgi:amino acid transporter